MRKWLIGTLTLIAATGAASTVYVRHRWATDPDLPLIPQTQVCERENLREGPLRSPAAIRAVEIAGVHLGMPYEDALRELRETSGRVDPMNYRDRNTADIIGRAGWSLRVRAWQFQPGALPFFPDDFRGHHSYLNVSTSIGRDGVERVSRLTYASGEDRPDAPARGFEAFNRKFGSATEAYSGAKGCRFSTLAAYGSDRRVGDPESLMTLGLCTNFPAPFVPSHTCDRRRAIRSPWMAFIPINEYFELTLEDGELTYASRYAENYKKSAPMRKVNED